MFAPWRSFLSLIPLQHWLSALRMRIDGNAERRTQEYLRFRRHEQPSFDSMEVRLWQHTRAVRQRKLQQPNSDQLESLVMAATPVRAKVSGVCDYPRGSNAQCCPQVLLQQRNLPPNRPNAPSCLPRYSTPTMSCQERRAHLEASHDSKLIESKVDAKAALDQAGAVRARPLVERREDGAKKPGLPARWPQQGGSLQYATVATGASVGHKQ